MRAHDWRGAWLDVLCGRCFCFVASLMFHAVFSLPDRRFSVRFWQLAHPLWLCPFRPMFALAMLSGWGLMAAWGAFLFWGWPLPAVAGGPFVWHAHELLLGFTLAAAAGLR